MSARDDNARDEPMPAALEGVPIITRRPANATPLRHAARMLANQRCLACGERIGSHPMGKLRDCAEQVQAAAARVGQETGEGARGALIIDTAAWPFAPGETAEVLGVDVWAQAPVELVDDPGGMSPPHPYPDIPDDDCAPEHGDACEGEHE